MFSCHPMSSRFLRGVELAHRLRDEGDQRPRLWLPSLSGGLRSCHPQVGFADNHHVTPFGWGLPSQRSMCWFSRLRPQLSPRVVRGPGPFTVSSSCSVPSVVSYVNQKNYFEKLFRLKLIQFEIYSISNFMFKFKKYVQTRICSNSNMFELKFVQIRICSNLILFRFKFVQTWFCSDSKFFKFKTVQNLIFLKKFNFENLFKFEKRKKKQKTKTAKTEKNRLTDIKLTRTCENPTGMF
jgi:hypothetical protein